MSDRGFAFQKPYLHVEEVQSDWGQNKRDGEDVPEGPHIGSTEGWTDLALKRILQEAAKGNYKKILFTAGKDQSDRYGLDKKFESIRWSPDTKELLAEGLEGLEDIEEKVHAEALPGFIGKDLADKLLSQPIKTVGNKQVHLLRGGDLKIENKGMRNYYDRKLPERMNKLVAQLDPSIKMKLFDHTINLGTETDDGEDRIHHLHSLEMTPKLRAAILKGLPAYASGGGVDDDQPQSSDIVDIPDDNVPPLPYEDTCMVHSLAHVTGKTPEEVWNVAHKYWKFGVGISPSMASHTVKELGHEWHRDRSDLVYPDISGPATTVKRLIERLKQEPEDKKFIITTRYYGVPHAISYANGELRDMAETKPNARVSLVSEIRPRRGENASGGSVIKDALGVVSKYSR
jgi:hypothetical protein